MLVNGNKSRIHLNDIAIIDLDSVIIKCVGLLILDLSKLS